MKPDVYEEDIPVLRQARPDWHADASCREFPQLSWFPAKGADQTEVRAICGGCLVLQECREWALACGPELRGIWGGLGSTDRADIRSKKSRDKRRVR